MATINHPGVVDIYDYGSDPAAGAYLVMEYVEGDALSRTLARVGRLTPARTMALVAQAADALHAAHEKGIVHRDVKPGNLLVRPNGTLVLTDFGIARSAGAAQLTAAGSVLGTASYISPEQAIGRAGHAGCRTCTRSASSPTSAWPAAGRSRATTRSRSRCSTSARSPPPLPPDIPPPVRAIVERAMAKDAGRPLAERGRVRGRRPAAAAGRAGRGRAAPSRPAPPPPVPAGRRTGRRRPTADADRRRRTRARRRTGRRRRGDRASPARYPRRLPCSGQQVARRYLQASGVARHAGGHAARRHRAWRSSCAVVLVAICVGARRSGASLQQTDASARQHRPRGACRSTSAAASAHGGVGRQVGR